MRKGLSNAVLCLVMTAVLLIVNHRQSPTELGRGFHMSPETIVYPGARVFSTDSNGELAFLNELVGVTQWQWK
jgi:hypothetical protein